MTEILREICVVVVTYGDRGKFLRTVLDGILSGRSIPGGIIVVDNGCPNPLTAPLTAHEVEMIVHLKSNLGSAGGFRAGIEAALAMGFQTVWLLDDDNLPDANCLYILTRAAQGQTIPVANRPGREEFRRIVLAGGCGPAMPNSAMGFALRGLSRQTWSIPHPNDRTLPLSVFGYGGSLVPRAAVERAGLPLAGLRLYHDDTEWSWRLTRAGWQARLVLDALVEDIDPPWGGFVRNGASPLFSRSVDGIRLYSALRNRAWLERRWGFGGPLWHLNWLIWTVVMALRTLKAERRPVALARRLATGFSGWRLGAWQRWNPEEIQPQNPAK